MKNMNNPTQSISDEMSRLADDARHLVTATADVAGEKVGEARRRLAAALERCKEGYGYARAKVVEGAKATDVVVHEHPYQAIGVALGVGVVIGYLAARGCSRNSKRPPE